MKTDWRKFRKSTHLASADLDALEAEGKKLIFTIKEVKYETGVDVSGTKMDGIFCYFKENVKPLKLNSTNMKVLASFAKNNGYEAKEANIIENWTNLIIELFVDRNVKMMGKLTEGIRIKPIQPKTQKPQFTELMFEKALKANYTIEMIKSRYTVTKEIENKYIEYGLTAN